MSDALQLTLTIVVLVLPILAVLAAVTSPRWSRTGKLLWCLVIVLVPIVGSLVYFVADWLRARKGSGTSA